jgi:hypothetical protein
VPTAGQARSGPLGALRLGTRLERLHSSHSYGFVLLLVFVSFAFTALMPATTWSEAGLVMIEASILSVALLTSGLPFGRYAVPLILLSGLVTAIALAATNTSFTRSSAAVVELAFLVGVICVIGAGVVDQGDVNSQSVLGALSIYVTVGMLFTVLYGVLADLGEGPFFAQSTDGDPATRVYFSFVTLATLGYGDFTPGSDLGRMMAVLEALVGQVYLVTVVALIVGNLGRHRERR